MRFTLRDRTRPNLAALREDRAQLIDAVVRNVLTAGEISAMSAHRRCDCLDCRVGVARIRTEFRQMAAQSQDYSGPSFSRNRSC